MSIISIRLNKNEERVLEKLISYYKEDKSTLVKRSLRELYEDLIDKDLIEEFETREKQGKVKFMSSDEVLENFF